MEVSMGGASRITTNSLRAIDNDSNENHSDDASSNSSRSSAGWLPSEISDMASDLSDEDMADLAMPNALGKPPKMYGGREHETVLRAMDVFEPGWIHVGLVGSTDRMNRGQFINPHKVEYQ